jgi:DNA helicase-2/ATP-dependent DNA helicase PcrA
VVYRTNAQSLGFETEFLRRKIPYRVVGSLKFYEREEVKDILALLSFLINPRDEIAFRRVVNKPSRGVGPATVDRIVGEANLFTPTETNNNAKGNLVLAAQRIAPGLAAKARSGIRFFLNAVEAVRAALGSGPKEPGPENSGEKELGFEEPRASRARAKNKKTLRPGEGLKSGVGLSSCVVSLAEESGIAEYHLTQDDVTGNQRLGNLQELANAASLYAATEEGLLEFLENIELDRSIEETADAGSDSVTLITLHNTKGLEFRRVIMTGVEQGVFPRDDKKDEDLEEERRLFYVGATRAMAELYLTSCAHRRMFGRTEPMKPSLFLHEIDRKELRIIGSVPYGFRVEKRERKEMEYAGNTRIPARKPLKSSDGRWTLGDRVHHDDHGYGSITQILEGGDGPVIKVIFETGHEMRFLSLRQSSNFTRIGDD